MLESIKLQSTADPKPFPISKQYKTKKNTKGNQEVEGDLEDQESEPMGEPEAAEVKSKGKSKGKNSQAKGKTNKVKAQAQATGGSGVKSDTAPCAYVPAEYSAKRKAFIDGLRKEGHSYTLANHVWNLSVEKRKLLCGLSVSELKRRRFLPAGETENPWAKWSYVTH